MHKGLIVGIVCIVFLVSGYGLSQGLKKKDTSSGGGASGQLGDVDLLIYQDEEKGIEFRYPEGWAVIEPISDEYATIIEPENSTPRSRYNVAIYNSPIKDQAELFQTPNEITGYYGSKIECLDFPWSKVVLVTMFYEDTYLYKKAFAFTESDSYSVSIDNEYNTVDRKLERAFEIVYSSLKSI